jgi:Tol biopolymer transport system component
VAATVDVEASPSWSPDGRMIAYDLRRGTTGDIWVTQLGGGPPVNRTADFPGPDLFPRWSPDGLQIAFSSLRDGGGVFLMSALAGGARKVGPFFTLTAAPPVWSPDSTELGYAVAEGNTIFLERLNLRDNKTSRIPLPGREGDARIDLAWSHDGRFIAYVDGRNYTAQVARIWILRLADGKAVPISNGLTNDWSPAWSRDSRSLYFASNRGGAMDIWHQRIDDDGQPAGDAEQLTQGLEVASLAVNREGTRIAYSKGRWLANVWRVPIQPDRPATFADARQLTFDQAHVEYLDVSRDGKQLAFSSDRSGNPDIWILPTSGGADPQPFARDPTPDWNPAWSFDDKHIAFYAYRSGNREVWIQPVAGGPATQLTSGSSESVFPRWSPDGKEIVYNSRMGGATDIWIRPASAAGNPRQIKLGPEAAGYPDWSPDGNWIAFQSRGGIWRVPVTGGEPTAVARPPSSRPHWSSDGQWIYFYRLNLGTGVVDVWRVSADGRKEQRLTNFEGRKGRVEGNAIDVDDNYIYIAWRDDIGDIWVMDIGARR